MALRKLTLLSIFTCIQFFGYTLTSEVIAGQIFVQLDPSFDKNISWDRSSSEAPVSIFNAFIDKYEVKRIYCPFKLQNEALQRTYIFEFGTISESEQLIQALEELSEVKYAEHVPNYSSFYVPNDPQFNTQWYLQTIQAEQAWNIITTQTNNVVIAVVDDAVLLSHDDLQANIWTNAGEIPNDNIDNDMNGYIDDVNGWDAADNDNNANPDNPTNSFFTHGTHCAGIASARTDNNTGIASIGFHSKIMPVKTATLPNPGSIVAGYTGVEYAIINNADVISMSWGGSSFSNTYQLIFDQAYNQGIVCVAAAGNSNTSAPMYPASYNHVISVGATDQNDQKASFSNYGSTIDVMAPGVSIYSCLAGANNAYGNMQGTSMACPMVSGLAALLLACDPNLSPDDVEHCIESTADNIYPVNQAYTGQLGAGRINAFNALVCAKQIVANFEANYTVACPNQPIQFSDLSGGSPTSWQWSFPGGTPNVSNLQNPLVSYNTPGTYNVSLTVSDGTNSDTRLINSYITIATPQATLSGSSTIIQGYSSNLQFNFTGNPPWSVTYSDGTSTFTVNNILTSPYYHSVSPTDTTTYTITGFSDAGCSGTFSGTNTINVMALGNSIGCYYTKNYGDANMNRIRELYYDFQNDDIYGVGLHAGTPLFARFNSSGDITHAVNIPGLTGSFVDIAPAPNGDKLCLSNNNEDIVVARFDNTGNLIWINRYNNARERGVRIIQSTGDSYIISCWYSPGGSSDDAAFMKIDGSGNIVWTTRFHSLDDQTYEIFPNGSGGAIFSGGIHGGGSVDMFVGEIDVNGTFGTIAEYNHSVNIMNEATRVIKTINNEYVAVSRINTANSAPWDANLIRLDANFNKIWEADFTYGLGRINQIDDLVEDINGDIYVSCRYDDNSPDIGVIVKFDANGNFIWSKEITDTRALVLVNTNSSPIDNLIVARFHNGNNFGSDDCFITRTDTALNSCLAVPVPTNHLTGVSTKTNLPYSVNSINFTNTPLALVPNQLTYQTNVICDSCTLDTLCLNKVTANFTSQTVCLGDTTFFSDLSTTTEGNISNWSWDLGDGNSSYGSPTPWHIYQNTGIYNVKLIVNNDTIPNCFDSIVNMVEVVDYMLTMPSDTTICIGDSLMLSPVNFACGSPIGWTFLWTGNSINNNSLQQPTVSPSQTTVYSLTATNGVVTLYGSVIITVDPNCCVSHPDFQPNQIWCEGDPLQFTNTSLATGAAIYNWDFGPNANPTNHSGASPPIVEFNGTGVFPVKLTLTDNCGIDSLIRDVVISALPYANAGLDQLACFPDTFKIGDSTIAGYSYLWTPGTLLNDSTSSSPITDLASDTTLVLTVIDNWTGCKATDTIVFNGPVADLDLGPDSTICNSFTTVTLDAGSSNTGANYLWQDGSTNQTLTVNLPGLYHVTVDYGVCIRQDSIDLIVQTLDVDFKPSDTTLCLPATIPFISDVNLNTGTVDSWLWSFGDGNESTAQDPLYAYEASGTYDVSLTVVSNYGCTATETKMANITTLTSAIADFSHTPSIGITEEPIQFNNLSKNASSWLWTFGDDSPQSSEQHPSHTYQEAKFYKVTLDAFNSNGCNDQTSIFITVKDDILIFVPNTFTPDGNSINQTWKYSVTGIDIYDFRMQVYNRWGELIWESHDPTAEWDGTYNGQMVQDGVYPWVMEFGDPLIDKRREFTGHVIVLR